MEHPPPPPGPAGPWVRVDDVGPEALAELRRALASARLPPGAAIFDLRTGDARTLFLTLPARPFAAGAGLPGPLLPCPPPGDHPRLRLLGGSPGAWRLIARRRR